MVLVVMDTNVIVSAALSQEGNPALIMKMFLFGQLKNSTSPDIIAEMREVLERPKITQRASLVEREFILKAIEEFSEVINPNLTFDEVKEDPDDNRILECAVAAAADFIISGDGHLLDLKEFRGIKIVSPAEFITLMTRAR